MNRKLGKKKAIVNKDNKRDFETFCAVFATYLMIIYVLVCPQGYVMYDNHKRTILFTGALLLGVYVVPMALITLFVNIKTIKSKITVTECLAIALAISWLVSMCGAVDISIAFIGDEYRYMGTAFMLINLATLCLYSRAGEWTDYIYVVFLLMCAGVWGLTILQYNRIDPWNWQFNFTRTQSMSTLGNINQVAYFSGILLATLIGIFLTNAKKWVRISSSIAIFIGFIGGCDSRSDNILILLTLVFIVLGGYTIFHLNQLGKVIIICGIIYAANLFRKLLYYTTGDNENWGMEMLDRILFNNKFLVLAGLAIAILAAVNFLIRNKTISRKTSNIIFICYLILLAIAFLGFLAFMYRNTINGTNKSFSFTQHFGTGRGNIWACVVDCTRQRKWGGKLFGSGMGGFVETIYHYEEEKILEQYNPGTILADGHNIIMDLLITTGLIGVILYIAFWTSIIVDSIKKIRLDDNAIVALLIIAAYLGGGIANSNLIITTPIAFLLIGFFRREKSREE